MRRLFVCAFMVWCKEEKDEENPQFLGALISGTVEMIFSNVVCKAAYEGNKICKFGANQSNSLSG